MQHRGGVCSGNDLGVIRRMHCISSPHGTGGNGPVVSSWTSLNPALVLQHWPAGLWTGFYITGGGPAQSPALIWLDKAPLWAELLLCASSQPVEGCRQCVALCSLCGTAAAVARTERHKDTPGFGSRQQPSSPLLILAVLLPSPAGKPETQKWGSAKSVSCHRSVSNVVKRAMMLHWSSRQT